MLADVADRTGLRWANAGVARCGACSPQDRYEQEFQTALALYGEEMAFERARTLLALGMPPPLTTAGRCPGRAARGAGLLRASGAEPWARQARAEVIANGETPPHTAVDGLRLADPARTPSGPGRGSRCRNREAAAALFLARRRSNSISATSTANSACAPAPSSSAAWRASPECVKLLNGELRVRIAEHERFRLRLRSGA